MIMSGPSTAGYTRLWLTTILVVWVGACAKTPPQSPPATGSVTVGVTSRGPGVERMSFGVAIGTAGIEGVVKGDVGIFTARNIPPGSYVVRMKDLPRGCRVEGDAQQTVRVSARGSSAVRFAVVCTTDGSSFPTID